MTPVSLAAADCIYACGADRSYTVHYARHARFRAFSLALAQMDRALGETASDDFWRDWLRQLRRYRFDVSAAPLPFDHPAAILEAQLSSLQARLVECDALFPDFAPPARALIEKLRDLVVAGDNPLVQALKRLFPDGPEQATAILVKESRLIPAAESVLEMDPHLREITVISAQQLRGATCYSRIAVIGRAGWFPDYVFMAPRARVIDIIQFDWLDARWEPSTGFAAGDKAAIPTFTQGEPGGLAPEQDSDTVDVIPPVDWDAIVATSKAQYRSEFKQEKTPARLVLLNGGLAVYLDGDEQATVTVIDADQDGGAAVKRVLVRQIEPGTFVLLRTEGGGDYIVPVADQIMGAQAVPARALQSRWKDLLADYVRRAGMQDTCRALERRGATHANETNVRNWQNKRKIRPEHDEDFTAILKLTELGASASDYRQAMKLIDNAHQRAGQRIRELLLAQVNGANLHDLHQLGRMEFELSDAGSGSLTAFRVEGLSPDVFPVPASLLGRPFDSEGTAWHE